MSTHFPTELSQSIQNQGIQQNQPSQPILSFNVHPGFLCFFKDFVDQKGWTFYQCYEKVAKSSYQLMKTKKPIQQIMNDDQKTKFQKFQQLQQRSQKNSSFACFTKNEQNNQIECFIIQKQKKAKQNINSLENKLKELEKIKQKVIKTKKAQFIAKQKKMQKQKQKIAQQEMKEKIRRANKVRQIQSQIKVKQQQKMRRKLKQEMQNPSSQSYCQIM